MLRPDGVAADAVWPGDDDPDTAHFAASAEGAGVGGGASLLRQPAPEAPTEPAWRLRGMATAPKGRGVGVGRRVLAAVVAHVADRGGGLLWCNARLVAAEFYRGAGFTAYSEIWDEPGIGPHIRMRRRVAARGSVERLGQVGDEVVGGLDPDREPDQPGVDRQR